MCIRDSYTFEKVPYGTYTVKIAENDGYTAEPVKVSLTGQNAIAATIRAEKKGQEDTEPNPDPDPVSYTHLDVYKRQGYLSVQQAIQGRGQEKEVMASIINKDEIYTPENQRMLFTLVQ